MAKMPTPEQLGAPPAPQPAMALVSDRSAGMATDDEGKALLQVGNDLQRVSDIMWQTKEKADTVRVEDAWNQYNAAATDYTAGPQGLLNTKGGDAVNGDLLGKSNMLLADARRRIAESLTDDQRARFEQRADVTDLNTKKAILGHLAQQQVEYSKTVFQGSEAAANAQVAAAPTDPGVFRGAHETLMAQADQYLRSNGVSDKGIADALKAKLTDAMWSTRINALLYSQPALADAMFRANEGQISNPELRLVLQNKTREVALTVVASNEAQGIMDETRMELAKPQPAAGMVEVGQAAPATGSKGDPGNPTDRIAPNVQLDRDRARVRLLEDELKDSPNDKDLIRELTSARNSVAKQEKAVGTDGGMRRVSAAPVDPLATNTNGLPNSRDVAAQLPIMMTKVEARANALYGKDPGNPDRAAFIRRTTAELQAKVSAEVTQLNAIQREAQGTLLDAVTGIGAVDGGTGLMNAGGLPAAPVRITSMDQIMADPKLARAYQMMDVQAKIGVQNLIERNLRSADNGDPIFYRELFNRIQLPPGDPQKIDFYQQITDPAIANRLSMAQISALRTEIDRSETPGGRSLNQMRKAADSNVSLYFKTHVMFTAQPDRQIAATMKWNEDAGRKIDQYVKEGRANEVRSLFMTDSKDSIVSPAFLQTYVNSTPAQGLATQAAGVRDGAPPLAAATQPKEIKTRAELDAWFATLPPNVDRFVGADGVTRMVPKRAASPDTPATPENPEPGIKMEPTGKVVTQPAEPAPVPKLVTRETPKQRNARIREEGEIAAVDRNVALVQGVEKIGRVTRGAQQAASAAIVRGAEALTPVSDQERVARTFRELVKQGSYTPASEEIILDAMDSGFLSLDEQKTARAMLRQIANQRKK